MEARITQGVAADMQAYGVEVTMVGIRRLSLPQAATEAVFDRMRADRQRLATEIREQGKERADAIRRKAEEERASLLVEAEKEARRLATEADREASPHYAEMAKAPDLAIFLKKLEALEKLLDQKTTLVLDSRQPPFDLLRPEPVGPEAGK